MTNTGKDAKKWRNNVWGKSIYKNTSVQKFAEAYVKYEILYMPVISLSNEQLQKQVMVAHDNLAAELGMNVSRAKMSALCYKFRWLFDDAIGKREADGTGRKETEPGWVQQVANQLGQSGRCGRYRGASRELEQVASALAERGWRRRTAEPVGVGRSALGKVWANTCELVRRKLWLLRARGDTPGEVKLATVLTSAEWRVADLLLMHGDPEPGVLVDRESVRLYDQLQPLITLFHLVQEHRIEELTDREELARRWTLVYFLYRQRGCTASLVMLQRRWYELKWQARQRILEFWRLIQTNDDLDYTLFPTPLHHTIIKQFPHVVTRPMKTWEELVKGGDVFPTLCIDQNKNENPVSSAHIHASTEQPDAELEDDLILIERQIETIEVEDENSDEWDDESDRLVIDEPQTDTTNAIKEHIGSDRGELDVKPNINNIGNIINCLKKEPKDTCNQTSHEPDNQLNNQPGDSINNVKEEIEELEQVEPTNVHTPILFQSNDDNSNIPAALEDIQKIDADNKVPLQVPVKIKSVSDEQDEVENKKLILESKQSNFVSRIRFEDEIDADTNETQLPPSGCTDENQQDCDGASEMSSDENEDSENSTKEIDGKLLMDTMVHLVKLDHTKSWKRYNRKRSINVMKIDYTELDPAFVQHAEEESKRRKAEEPLKLLSDNSSDNSDFEDEVVLKFLKQRPRDDFNKRKGSRASRWMIFKESDEKLCGTSENDKRSDVKIEKETDTNTGVKRVTKRVELPDIEEVRRINSNILTAQVAPLLADGQEQPNDGCIPTEEVPHDVAGQDFMDHTYHDALTGEKLPTQRVLDILLKDLSNRERKRQTAVRGAMLGLSGPRGPYRGQYCCSARRDRAINDARRRMAERAGRAFLATPIHKHRGACTCCCLHLLTADTSSRLSTDLTRLSHAVRDLLRPDNPHYQDVLDLMSEISTDIISEKLQKSSKSKEKPEKKSSQSKQQDSVFKRQAPKEDGGYAEWMQQRNLCAKYFELRGSSSTKTNKPTDKQIQNTQTVTPVISMTPIVQGNIPINNLPSNTATLVPQNVLSNGPMNNLPSNTATLVSQNVLSNGPMNNLRSKTAILVSQNVLSNGPMNNLPSSTVTLVSQNVLSNDLKNNHPSNTATLVSQNVLSNGLKNNLSSNTATSVSQNVLSNGPMNNLPSGTITLISQNVLSNGALNNLPSNIATLMSQNVLTNGSINNLPTTTATLVYQNVLSNGSINNLPSNTATLISQNVLSNASINNVPSNTATLISQNVLSNGQEPSNIELDHQYNQKSSQQTFKPSTPLSNEVNSQSLLTTHANDKNVHEKCPPTVPRAPPAANCEPIVIEDEPDKEQSLPDKLHLNNVKTLRKGSSVSAYKLVLEPAAVERGTKQGGKASRRLVVQLPHIPRLTSVTPLLPLPDDGKACAALRGFLRRHSATTPDKPIADASPYSTADARDDHASSAGGSDTDTASTTDSTADLATADASFPTADSVSANDIAKSDRISTGPIITCRTNVVDTDLIATDTEVADTGVTSSSTDTTRVSVAPTGTAVTSTVSNVTIGSVVPKTIVALCSVAPPTTSTARKCKKESSSRGARGSKVPLRAILKVARVRSQRPETRILPNPIVSGREVFSRSLLRPGNLAPPAARGEGVGEGEKGEGERALQPMGGLVKAADYIEGHDPTDLRVLCKEASTPFWVLARHYIVLTSSPYEKEFASPQYYTFDPIERAAKLVFPGQGGGLLAPDNLTIANKSYKKMSETPLRYAQVYFVVADMHECRRLVLADRSLHMFCCESASLTPLQPRRTACRKLVGLHCTALRPLEELVYLFNSFPAPQKIVASSSSTSTSSTATTSTGSTSTSTSNARSKRNKRKVQATVNKRADLALLVTCLNTNKAQVVELDSDGEH